MSHGLCPGSTCKVAALYLPPAVSQSCDPGGSVANGAKVSAFGRVEGDLQDVHQNRLLSRFSDSMGLL